MSIVSIKEAVEGVIDIVESNLSDEIVSIEYTGIINRDTLKAKDFPRIYLFVNDPVSFNENANSFPLDIMFVDVMTGRDQDWKRDFEIKSDMTQAASKLFDLMQNAGYFDGDVSVTLQPATEDLNNGLSGLSGTVPISLEKPCYEV